MIDRRSLDAESIGCAPAIICARSKAKSVTLKSLQVTKKIPSFIASPAMIHAPAEQRGRSPGVERPRFSLLLS
jgi:hypothetical protein